ncbi:DUF4163 domain-containing protein [Sphingopyxis macrogoltabida]|uniref:Deacetylase PdaC domain-containing protein n=1 Tax=Sphingopyxis macrogoltabida TaxID=33050 RepID=A0AAC8YY14_SPHMC|nr:DUF4163 domain-containing protein [Sphingopyxis macrogoltabida]ALJ12175.1 hypothetical protein LH19_04775 [Sphingopyxis macrogoltabida]AMU88350.1 hypothetical protein ATM17_04735 [Sphingopyxis macrogoltabida]
MTNLRHYPSAALLLSGALILTACSEKPDTPAEKAAAAAVPGAPPGGPADVAAKNAPASDVKEKNELVEFAYSYPAEAAQIPGLAAWLDNDRATQRDALVSAARRDQAAADKEGFPYYAHSHLQKWQRITSTPRFLSLSAEIETYMGGAHGMQTFDTLVWDRNRAKRLKPLDMFASGEAFDKAVNDDLCAAIERAKAARGVEWVRDGSPFGKCPSAAAQTVWLGSSDGRYLDRLTIAIAPYEIGAYAEGSYKINLPMSQAIVHAVKPEYARDFLPTK